MMTLDPDAERILDLVRASGRPPYQQMTPAEARAVYAAGRAVVAPDPEEVAEVAALSVPGKAGPIPVRAYRPRGVDAATITPALVYFHGGGWVFGDLDSHDVVCRRLANAAGCRVFSVDYRLAPEHRFPAAVEDSLAATAWVAAQAGALGVDPARIAVGGDSAGGNLAAVMALLARDGALPKLAFQLLIYPVTDLAMTSGAYRRVTDGVPLVADTMRWFIDHYLNDMAERVDWQASPLRAANLAGTAPAMVVTAAHDPLCDEGVAYARRLEAEGVPVTALHFSDQIHGFITMGRIIRAADIAIDACAATLRRAFGPITPFT